MKTTSQGTVVNKPPTTPKHIPYGQSQKEVVGEMDNMTKAWNNTLKARRKVKAMLEDVPAEDNKGRGELEKVLEKIQNVEEAVLKAKKVLQEVHNTERRERQRITDEATKKKAMDIVSLNFPGLIGYKPDYWLAKQAQTIDRYNEKVQYLRRLFVCSEEKRECIVSKGQEEKKLRTILDGFGIKARTSFYEPDKTKVTATIPGQPTGGTMNTYKRHPGRNVR